MEWLCVLLCVRVMAIYVQVEYVALGSPDQVAGDVPISADQRDFSPTVGGRVGMAPAGGGTATLVSGITWSTLWSVMWL